MDLNCALHIDFFLHKEKLEIEKSLRKGKRLNHSRTRERERERRTEKNDSVSYCISLRKKKNYCDVHYRNKHYGTWFIRAQKKYCASLKNQIVKFIEYQPVKAN